MTEQISRSSRRAALLVHALSPADRAWLLESLNPVDRAPLEALLAELQALGIPRDDALINQTLRVSLTPASSSVEDELRRLDAAQVRLLAHDLQRECPTLAARLLAAHEWPWQAMLLEYCEAEFAHRVRAAAPALPAPALEAAVCQGALRELRSRQQQIQGGKRMSDWRQLWSRRRQRERA